jgi:hypothetical protein
MTDDVCRREADVRKGNWSDELRAHAETCPDCAAAAAVGPWLTRFAALPDREHLLPDPSVVWLKAQLLRNTAAADRAMRPMTSIQLGAYLIVAACWAAVLTWKWDVLDRWLHRLTPGQFVLGASADAATSASLSITFLVALLVLSSLTIMLALHTILAEE